MRHLQPRRRDPAQATPDRCHRCKSTVPTRPVQTYEAGQIVTRATPISYPRQVLGAGNKPVTVWLCAGCMVATRDGSSGETGGVI